LFLIASAAAAASRLSFCRCFFFCLLDKLQAGWNMVEEDSEDVGKTERGGGRDAGIGLGREIVLTVLDTADS
jgi:hypothetical protein